MNLAVVLFAAVAAVTATGAVGVAASRSMVRAGVWLLFTLVGVAGVYFLLGAEFLGAAQLIVYVGGTLVLVVFGVMITNQGPFAVLATKRMEWVIGGVLAAGLFALLVKASLNIATPPQPLDVISPTVSELGMSFLGIEEGGKSYLLPFEIVSVHLLVVLIAAAYLARAKRRVGENLPPPAPPSSQEGGEVGSSTHPSLSGRGAGGAGLPQAPEAHS